MNVTLGVWISNDLVANEYEINRAIDIANRERNIDLVIVGNEALYSRRRHARGSSRHTSTACATR